MGLYQIYKQGPEFVLRYNCSFYNVDDVPLEKRQHRFFAVIVFTLGVIFLTLYCPCIYALIRLSKSNFCYKLMIAMSLQDIVTLFCTTLFPAFQSYHGYVYCSNPILSLIIGSFIISFWIAYSQTSLLLAINRSLCFSTSYQHIFEGKKQYLLLSLPWLICMYVLLFGTSGAYSSISNGWYFDPHRGYKNDVDSIYSSPIQFWNNIIFIISLPIIYVLFVFKNFGFTNNARNIPKKEIALFVQTVVVNFAIAMAALGYTVMQYITSLPQEVIALSHITWVLVSGALPVVLLTMNTSVRKIIKNGNETSTRAQGSRTQATTRTATRTTQVNTRTRVSPLTQPDTSPA
ncbi:7TM GPCR, serpentine receptor class t (Srt) family-containing protein [Aphelenchoides besseyi]|nr:7TM GPCR, serpentine receptor class t (Srt) family-containing protein [Aphelenchoides besseyi]